ncbi:hypothetical protein L1049_013467 [Liquidambar formosana]|uniref:Uncharacterized protein n=1 Tax=Liquidambar formosana TaxID=63359 RepID=A0AAP0RPB2_LIQFO
MVGKIHAVTATPSGDVANPITAESLEWEEEGMEDLRPENEGRVKPARRESRRMWGAAMDKVQREKLWREREKRGRPSVTVTGGVGVPGLVEKDQSDLVLCDEVLDEYQENFGDLWRTIQENNTQQCQWPTDEHHPPLSAFSLFLKVLEYQKNFGDSRRAIQEDNTKQQWPFLNEALIKFQDPAEADELLKIQRDFDETNDITHKTIFDLVARGGKFISLVEKINQGLPRMMIGLGLLYILSFP